MLARVRVDRAVLAALLAINLWGCALVKMKVASKEDVSVVTRFGIVSLVIKPDARAVIAESTSFGIVNGLTGIAVGYHNTSFAALGDNRCQIVLWIRADDELRELNSLLRDRTDVCVVPSNHQRAKP